MTVSGPRAEDLPGDLAGILAAGAGWWPLAMARELDDALLMLRANEPEIGTLVLKTRGEARAVLGLRRDHGGALATTGSCARRSA